MKNLVVITNRAPAAAVGGWIHIVPKGELANAENGIMQVLDDPALDSILANIAADKARLGDNWPGIYAGREHFIYDPAQDSAALAWFKDFEKRPDGIWAGADGLTAAGAEALRNGEYKYTSFVADPADMQKIGGSRDGLPCYRVMAIETVGFTNLANGKELLTPITNRGEYGSHGTKEAHDTARAENLRHVQANKDAAAAAEARRTADSEGEAEEMAVPELEKFCRAVKSVMDATAKMGAGQMDLASAWSYAKSRWPDLYAAGFGTGADDEGDEAAAASQVSKIANRIGLLAGKNFDFGFNFVRAELPMVFNRLAPARGPVMNRTQTRVAQITPANAAKVLNRLVRAELALKPMPEKTAHAIVKNRHPGLYGLASGQWLASDAIRTEPGIMRLLA